MKLLVTGGAGHVGSVVTVLLLREGHEVTVLDDLSTGHRDGVPEGARPVTGGGHDRARDELGWKPRRSLDETVADAWAFARTSR